MDQYQPILALILLLGLTGDVDAVVNVTGITGSSVLFEVNPLPPENSAITWTFIGAIVAQNFPSPICFDHLIGSCQLYVNGSLRLDNVSSSNEGSYGLSVLALGATTPNSTEYRLRVYAPLDKPVLRIISDSMYVVNGTNVTLLCDAGSQTVTAYTFYRDQKPICTEPHVTCRGSSLDFTPISEIYNGSYTCRIENPVTFNLSDPIPVTVSFPISDISLTANTSGLVLPGLDSVSLRCSAHGTNVSYSWSLDGAALPPEPHYVLSADRSILTIQPVSSKDNGSFTCTATNSINNLTSPEVLLHLGLLPDGEMSCPVTSNGDILSLVCSWENGRPPANVTMTFNDTTEMNPNIVTRNVSSKTLIWGSVLNCSGDQLGKKSTCLQILEPPYSPGHNNNTIKVVTEGGSVTLTINITPIPTSRISSNILPATFTWYMDKTEIKSGVTSTNYSSNLHISEVTQANSGRYECTARNVIGSETFIFNVNVTAKAVPPKNGLNGGEIAGIVIGVLAGLTIIGIIIFFIVKKKKRHNDDRRLKDSTDQIDTIQYAEVALNKENGGVAETSINPTDDKDELKYAVINFQNKSSTKSVAPSAPQETVYSDVKNASKR